MKDIEKKVLEKLREVIDPEIGFDVVSLGEIEEIKYNEKGNKVYVKFLPTTPLCPFLGYLVESIEAKVKELGYDVEVIVDLDNRWDISRIDPEVRKKLGLE